MGGRCFAALAAMLCVVAAPMAFALPNLSHLPPTQLSLGVENLKEIFDHFSSSLPAGVSLPASVDEMASSIPAFQEIIDKLGHLDVEGLEKIFHSHAASLDTSSINALGGKFIGALERFKESSSMGSKNWGELVDISSQLGDNLEKLSKNQLLPGAGHKSAVKDALTRSAESATLLAADASELKLLFGGITTSSSMDVKTLIESFKQNSKNLGEAFADAELANLVELGDALKNPLTGLNLSDLAEEFKSVAPTFEEAFSGLHLSVTEGLAVTTALTTLAAEEFISAFNGFLQHRNKRSPGRSVAAFVDSLKETTVAYANWLTSLKSLLTPFANIAVDGMDEPTQSIFSNLELAKDILANATDSLKNDVNVSDLMVDSLSGLFFGLNTTHESSIVWKDMMFQIGMQKSVAGAIGEDAVELVSRATSMSSALDKLESLAEIVSVGDMSQRGLEMITGAIDDALEFAESLLQATLNLASWKSELGFDLLDMKNESKFNVLELKNATMAAANLTEWWTLNSKIMQTILGNKNATLWDLFETKNETLVDAMNLSGDAVWEFLQIKNGTLSDLLDDKNATFYDFVEQKNLTALSFADIKDQAIADFLEDQSKYNLTEAIAALEVIVSELKASVASRSEHSIAFNSNLVISLRNLLNPVLSAFDSLENVRLDALLDAVLPAIRSVMKNAIEVVHSFDLDLLPAGALGLEETWSDISAAYKDVEFPEVFDLLDISSVVEAGTEFKELALSGQLGLTNFTALEELKTLGLTVKEEAFNGMVSEMLNKGRSFLDEFEQFKNKAELLGVPIPDSVLGAVNITHGIVADIDLGNPTSSLGLSLDLGANITRPQFLKNSVVSGLLQEKVEMLGKLRGNMQSIASSQGVSDAVQQLRNSIVSSRF